MKMELFAFVALEPALAPMKLELCASVALEPA